MRTIRRTTLGLATAAILTIGAAAPATATTNTPAERPTHISAKLCVWGGGHVIHYPWYKVCIGGLFHGKIVY